MNIARYWGLTLDADYDMTDEQLLEIKLFGAKQAYHMSEMAAESRRIKSAEEKAEEKIEGDES